MLERILSRDNLLRAWHRVRVNKGAAGVDSVTIDEFPAYLKEHWPEIKRKVLDGTYKPSPVKRVEIPKRAGGKRPLGIPTVLDRVIQQAILQVLQPIFDSGFSESSFGFRPRRSAQDAVRKVRQIIDEGYKHVVDVDLSQFFDRVDHDLLMIRVARKVKDKRVLRLIGLYLRCGVEVNGNILPTTKGVPQGGPLSPLLANIMLDDFDKELEMREHHFVRYADDFLIFVKSERAAQRVLRSVTRWLKHMLKLSINYEKSKIVKANECDYLGFIFKNKRIIWSDESLENFKYNIRRLIPTYVGTLSEYYRPLPELDEWIRRRVRMCYIKRWR
jgi:RNA-directed DNA polymerase